MTENNPNPTNPDVLAGSTPDMCPTPELPIAQADSTQPERNPEVEQTVTSPEESLERPDIVELVPADNLARIMGKIDMLHGDFQLLAQGFDSKIKYDAGKERIIDSLHRELQAYRDGLHLQFLRPLFFDLISMHDDLTNMLKHNRPVEGECETTARLRQNLESFQETIESILESHGVIAYNEAGDQYVPQRQRVAGVENSDDPAKDRLIFERVRKGFEYEGKVLRPESVILHKYTSPTSS